MTTKRAAILEELQQFGPLPDLGPDEITIGDIAEAYNVTRYRAESWANDQVREKRLERLERYDTRINKPVNAWRLADGVSCTESDENRHFNDMKRYDPDEMRPPDEEGDEYH